MSKRRSVVHVFWLALALLALAAFVWPTLYRYDHIRLGGDSFPVRINRIRGGAEQFSGGRWWARGDSRGKPVQPLAAPGLSQLRLKGGFRFGSAFYGELYNGSQFKLTELDVRVVAQDPGERHHREDDPLRELACRAGDTVWTRVYRTAVDVDPLTTGSVHIDVGDVSWLCASTAIVTARGMERRP